MEERKRQREREEDQVSKFPLLRARYFSFLFRIPIPLPENIYYLGIKLIKRVAMNFTFVLVKRGGAKISSSLAGFIIVIAPSFSLRLF